ncbi:MAG: M1 family metallopeptidase [Chitinophagales bacterium]
MFHRFLVVLAIVVMASSCTSTKKLNKDGVSVNLDTVTITVSRDNPYRASATKDFDLDHTNLKVSFDYEHQYLFGKALITLHPHFYPQNQLVLDAKQFDIHSVSIVRPDNSYTALNFTYDSLQLKIQLDREYKASEKITVFIDYTAKPEERKVGGSAAINSDKGLYFINPLGKDTTKPIQIWTQGETESNSCWFPTIDKPDQKMTDEIYITRKKNYVSLSNGTLVSSTDNADGTATDYWKMSLPHSPYLVMMAVGDFAIVHDRWREIPVDYYVEKAYEKEAKGIFGNTPEMIEFFSQKLGFEYPWSKYHQIIVRDYVSGAMENTTATLHGDFLQRDSRERLDETYEDVVSHELFHQWFGDLVTTESWSNIPLNESFATYGEYLWNEYKYGKEQADYKLWENYEKYMEESAEKNVDLIRFYYNDREDMFDRHSYEKGGLLLHYLRNIVGDEAFFKSLELYLKTNQFKNVEMHQLRLAFEEVTGRDMNWFFNEWFLSSGHPVLDIKYSYDADSAYVTITQKHNIEKGQVYTLPMKVDVWYAAANSGGKYKSSYDIVLTKKEQRFAFKTSGTPLLIDADASRVVLCEKTENKSIDNYAFQYKNGALYNQRYEALVALVDTQKTFASAKEAVALALYDPFFYLRKIAVEEVDLSGADKDSLLHRLEILARTDKNSQVRTSAIERLSKSPAAGKYTDLYEFSIGDSSYLVVAAALKALNEQDSKKAMSYAKQFEANKTMDMQTAVADVYAREGDAGYQDYFEQKLKSTDGITKYYMFYYYANFLTRMDKNVVLSGAKSIEQEGMQLEGHYMQAAAKGSLKRIVKSFEEKKKRAQSDLSKEEGQTAKLNLQEKIADYDTIISTVKDAVDRFTKKAEENKGQ